MGIIKSLAIFLRLLIKPAALKVKRQRSRLDLMGCSIQLDVVGYTEYRLYAEMQ
jgi:hypothetical protein